MGKDQHGFESCENYSTLFVSKDPAKRFENVFVARPVKGGPQGNGLQLIDWSPNSGYLLADLLTWWYASEGWVHNVAVYSVQGGSVAKLDLNSAFSRHVKKQCSMDGKLLGFLQDGRVVFQAWGVPDEEGESCVSRKSLWAVDWKTATLRELPEGFRIRKYGRFD